MKQPMTEARAIDMYECAECATTQQKTFCASILEATFSVLCNQCEQPVYFTGNPTDLDTPLNFECPYCGKHSTSSRG